MRCKKTESVKPHLENALDSEVVDDLFPFCRSMFEGVYHSGRGFAVRTGRCSEDLIAYLASPGFGSAAVRATVRQAERSECCAARLAVYLVAALDVYIFEDLQLIARLEGDNHLGALGRRAELAKCPHLLGQVRSYRNPAGPDQVIWCIAPGPDLAGFQVELLLDPAISILSPPKK
jgi:hypothetical protein